MAARKRKAPGKRSRLDADAGVRHCMDLMANGRWVSGQSHADVAFVFGVAPSTVKDWATSASRVLRLAIEPDREDLRAQLVATLQGVCRRAMAQKHPDLRNAIAAVAEQGKLLGLVSQKVDLTTRPSVTHMSREEHAAELEKLAAEIAAEKARIESEGA